jgi:hypothetical protein
MDVLIVDLGQPEDDTQEGHEQETGGMGALHRGRSTASILSGIFSVSR